MIRKALFASISLLFLAASVRADIALTIDPSYPSNPPLFTIDPEPLTVAQRGITGTRQLRQTFQLSSTLAVDSITLSLVLNGTNGGLVVSFYEVADVNAATWAAGSLVKTLTLSTNVDLPTTTTRLGLSLSGGDIFTLSQRDSGTTGYGIEIANADGVQTIGNIRHSNNGVDNFAGGRFYTESGAQSGNGDRDFGLALAGAVVPEPETYLLAGLGAMSLLLFRRWMRPGSAPGLAEARFTTQRPGSR